jgi:dynein heavy chain
MQPRNSGGGIGQSNDVTLSQLSGKWLQELPVLFDVESVSVQYPVDYNESMNTVLNQELLRFNKLLRRIRSTLVDIGNAAKGLVVMNAELEVVADGILQSRTPDVWLKVSYPSLKPIASYVGDLIVRLHFFQEWIQSGAPCTFWLSGFFFTQSFLTGQLQNFARKMKLPIDSLVWNFKVLKASQKQFDRPDVGCIVNGLFMDGARWDDIEGVIAESHPKVLFDALPFINMVPTEMLKDGTDRRTVYPSPVYKTSERKGVLSTTGHSTNFVMTMLLPISRQHNEKYWTKRGVACLAQTDD